MSSDLIRYQGGLAKPNDNSLQAKIRKHLAATRPQQILRPDTALLLDVSGSMWGDPIRKLREAVRAFPAVRKFDFDDYCREIPPGEECREPCGGTMMEVGFNEVKARGISSIILITDGHPNDAHRALQAAQGLHIDIIYIGPPPPPPFLQALATACGGVFDPDVNFAADNGAKSLEAKVRGLLPAPEATETKRVIEL